MQKELTGWQRLLKEDPTGILEDEKLVKILIKHLETLKSDAIDYFRTDKDSSIWKKDIVAINAAIKIIGIAYNMTNDIENYQNADELTDEEYQMILDEVNYD